MKYICEICNHQYDTILEAEKCELTHKREKFDAEEKKRAESQINEAINEFISKYNELPHLEIDKDNQSVLLSWITESLEDIFSILDEIETNDGDDCCDCGKCNRR